jgi:PAS domain S-box-containing protein
MGMASTWRRASLGNTGAEVGLPTGDAAALRNAALVRALGEIVYEWSPITDEIIWDGDFTRILGYTPDEMGDNTESWTSRIHPEDLGRALREVKNATRERRLFDMEYRFRHKDGSYRWMHDRGVTFINDAGVLERLIGVFRDITDRRRSEDLLSLEKNILELISSGYVLREILDALNTGIEKLTGDAISTICLLDAKDKSLWLASGPGLPGDFIRAIGRIKPGPRAGSCGTAAYRNERVIVSDVMQDPLWADYREHAARHGLRACWSMPIRSTDRQVLGTFALYYRGPRAPAAGEIELIERMAALAGIAIERDAARKALHASALMYRTLYDDNPSMYFTVAADGTVRSVNEFGARELGYAVRELIGRPMMTLVAEEDREEVRRHFDECLARPGRLYQRKFRKIRKGGELLWVEEIARAVTTPGGDTAILIVCHDITEREETLLRLRRSEERLELALDALDGGVWDWNVQTGEVYFSPSWEKMLGYNPGELKRHVSSWEERLHPDDRPSVIRILQEYLSGKTPQYRVEYRLRAKSGEWIWTVGRGGVIERSADGTPLRMAGTNINITERKLAEQALAIRARQMEFISELSRMVLTERDLNRIYDFTVHGLAAILNVEYSKILELLPSSDRLLLRAGVGWREGLVGKATTPCGRKSQAGYTLLSKMPVVVTDLRKERRFTRTAFLRSHGVVSGMSVIIGEPEEPFGILGVHTRSRREFSEDDVRFLGNAANVLAEAIWSQRAERLLLESSERLRNLAARLQAVREEERTMMAREIHDELGQTLTGLRIDLAWVLKHLPDRNGELMERMRSAMTLVDRALITVRRISHDLRPAMLDDLGLDAAIEWQAEEFARRTGCECKLNLRAGKIGMDNERDTGIFRVLQEALTNVSRHAAATRVKVSLRIRNGMLVLEVSDNGRGISRKALHSSESIGLIGMRERANSLGGRVQIARQRRGGTKVCLEIPLHIEGRRAT